MARPGMTLRWRALAALAASSALCLASGGAQAGQPAAPADLPQYCKFVPAPSQSLPGATSFTYRQLGNRTLRIHVFSPPGDGRPRPAAIFFYGGGFRTGDV